MYIALNNFFLQPVLIDSFCKLNKKDIVVHFGDDFKGLD